MDTLGSLIDKLITVDMKMWHNQEVLYEIRRMSVEDFKLKWGGDLEGLYEVLKKCCDLNVQRADMMDAIDQYFEKALQGEGGRLTRPQHKTY